MTIDTVEDSYQNIVPYLLSNSPVLVRTHSHNLSLLRENLLSVRAHEAFCTRSKCDVEKDVNENDDATRSQGYSKTRNSMTLEAFFSEAIDNVNESIYLKDWHIDQAKDESLSFKYRVAEAFRDDWLNWYWKSCRAGEDDYSFLYIGGRNTSTALHHDVCCSNSWSVNLFGRKKWTLWPPSESHKLAKHYSATSEEPAQCRQCSVDNFSSQPSKDCCFSKTSDVRNRGIHDGNNMVSDARVGWFDEFLYPGVSGSKCVTIIQDVDDVIFVPSGWYHQVENIASANSYSHCFPPRGLESLTVSLNRNWFNGFSVREVWLFLSRELDAVRKEISHMSPDTNITIVHGTVTNEIECDTVGKNTNSNESRIKHPALFSDYTPRMGVMEWNRHAEILLKANAAMGSIEFLELISARVLMMEACKARSDRESASLDDQNVGSGGTEHSGENYSPITTFKSIESISWSSLFCPRYTADISDDDLEVFDLLSAAVVSQLCESDVHRLSSYMKFHWDSPCRNNHINKEEAVSSSEAISQLTALKYTCLQLDDIVSEMLTSESFLLHIGCSTSLANETCGDNSNEEFLALMQHIESNLRNLKKSISQLTLQ